MARNRDPFTQALGSLRDRIHSGAIPGGAPVIVVDEALRLNLSTTPVREALARLSGEGLVVRAAPGGYFVLPLDVAAVYELYDVQRHYVRIAVETNVERLGALHRPAPPFDDTAPQQSVQKLFGRLINDTGNAFLVRSYGGLTEQLRRTRPAEQSLFSNLHTEGEALFETYAIGSPAEFLDAVYLYHRRRLEAAATLASMINDPTPE